MEILAKHGSYEVISYNDNLIAIDFSNENVGLTVKTYSNKVVAMQVFNEIIKPLSLRNAKLLKEDTRKALVYSV